MSMKRSAPPSSDDGDDVSEGLIPALQMPEIPEEDNDSDDDAMSELKDKKKRLRSEIERLKAKVKRAEAELSKTSGFNEERWRELLVSFVLLLLFCLTSVPLFSGLRLGATK
jgi:hypothetical protein